MTTYHLATVDPIALAEELNQIPANQRLKEVLRENRSQEAAIKTIRHNFAATKVLIDSLPEKDKVAALLYRSYYKDWTPMEFCIGHCDENALKDFLASLARETVIEIFTSGGFCAEITKYPLIRELMLSSSEKSSEKLPVIMEFLPEEIRFTILKYECTEKHMPFLKMQVIQSLLNQLSQEHSDQILQTMLGFAAARRWESEMRKLLELVLPAKRIAALKADFNPHNKTNADSALAMATQCPVILQVIMEALPQDQRLDFLLGEKVGDKTVVECAIFDRRWQCPLVEELANFTAPLDDEQTLTLLRTRIGKDSVLKCFVEELRSRLLLQTKDHHPVIAIDTFTKYEWLEQLHNPLDPTHKSHSAGIAADIVAVYSYLSYQYKILRSRESLFHRSFCQNEAGKLLAQLDQCRTAAELISTLVDYIKSKQLFSKDLFNILRFIHSGIVQQCCESNVIDQTHTP